MGEDASLNGALDAVVLTTVDANASALAALQSSGPYELLYLGASFAAFELWKANLPEGWKLLPTGELLNETAAEWREFMIRLDAVVVSPARDRSWWDSTHFGERNPLASSFLLDFSRLMLLRKLLAQGKRIVVVADDPMLRRLIAGVANCAGCRVGWDLPGKPAPLAERLRRAGAILRYLARGARAHAGAFVQFVRRKRMIRLVRRDRPTPLAALRRARLLIVSWADASSFPPGAACPTDPFLPGIAAIALEAGLEPVYLVKPMPGLADFRAVAAAAASFPAVLFEELLPMGEVLRAALLSFLVVLRIPRVAFVGLDITSLMRLEALRELASTDGMFARCHKAAAKGLATLGVVPCIAIHPYEHQPWEKMLTLGIRRQWPRTRLVGIQHSPFAWNYVSFFPSHHEFEAGMVPDRLFVIGDGYADWFRAAGFANGSIAVTGAMRYTSAAACGDVSGDSVLCCTDIALDAAIELCAKAILATSGLGHLLMINYHPLVDERFRSSLRDQVARLVGEHAHVRFVDARAIDLLDEARVVLYSTSAAAFDALRLGKRVIYVMRDTAIDLDKVPDGLSRRRRSIDTLRAALVEVFEESAASDRDAGADIKLQRWLGPTDRSAIRSALVDLAAA